MEKYPKCYPTMIKCPSCDTVQGALIQQTEPFNTYIHDCKKCGYTIMESEWDTVEPFIKLPAIP